MLGDRTILDIVILIVSILIALTVHEFMHGFVAFKLGDKTAFEGGRVTFNPLQHIDPFMTVLLPIITIVAFGFPFLAAKPVPFNPAYLKYDEYGAAMVAAAGPLTNLGLAFIAALADNLVAAGSLTAHVLGIFVALNVAIFIFNLIPIPPLDGSRILYAFAPEPVQKFFDQIEPYGLFIIIALLLLGGFGGIIGNLNNAVINLLP